MKIKFFYFDMGNVLLTFSHRLAARQIADLCQISPQQAWDAVFDGELQLRYEAGQISTDEFYQAFCQRTDTKPELAALLYAASAMFEVNATMLSVVAMLQAAGHRTGVLSNTCTAHWDYVRDGRYTMLPGQFEVFALSFEIGVNKPDEKIYHASADLANVSPSEILFVDDRLENVEAAQAAGFDAVLYTSTEQYVRDLVHRGVRMNY